MLAITHENPLQRRSSSSALNQLAGQNIFCSEFRYRAGTVVFGEAEPAEYFYQVQSGAIRSYKLLDDGRRQIIAFHLPGDIFGVESGAAHRFTAEAIIATTVKLTKRQNVIEEHGGRATATNNVLGLVTRNLQHAEDHMLLLGRKTAFEKVSAFLVEMDDRLTATGVVMLPMKRRDIADYLGLTVETVARVLTRLKNRNVLTFIGQANREIVLRDRAKLAQFGFSSGRRITFERPERIL